MPVPGVVLFGLVAPAMQPGPSAAAGALVGFSQSLAAASAEADHDVPTAEALGAMHASAEAGELPGLGHSQAPGRPGAAMECFSIALGGRAAACVAGPAGSDARMHGVFSAEDFAATVEAAGRARSAAACGDMARARELVADLARGLIRGSWPKARGGGGGGEEKVAGAGMSGQSRRAGKRRHGSRSGPVVPSVPSDDAGPAAKRVSARLRWRRGVSSSWALLSAGSSSSASGSGGGLSPAAGHDGHAYNEEDDDDGCGGSRGLLPTLSGPPVGRDGDEELLAELGLGHDHDDVPPAPSGHPGPIHGPTNPWAAPAGHPGLSSAGVLPCLSPCASLSLLTPNSVAAGGPLQSAAWPAPGPSLPGGDVVPEPRMLAELLDVSPYAQAQVSAAGPWPYRAGLTSSWSSAAVPWCAAGAHASSDDILGARQHVPEKPFLAPLGDPESGDDDDDNTRSDGAASPTDAALLQAGAAGPLEHVPPGGFGMTPFLPAAVGEAGSAGAAVWPCPMYVTAPSGPVDDKALGPMGPFLGKPVRMPLAAAALACKPGAA